MSKLVFDGSAHRLTLFAGNGAELEHWVAYNNVDRHASLTHLPNGTYMAQDRVMPHHHTARANGPYGLHGILRLFVPGHVGVGIHAGRVNARHLPGPKHPTMGCIRTTDEAMAFIGDTIRQDMLSVVEVENNSAVSGRNASRGAPHALAR